MFAETDIVNLVKSGIPAEEILNSLADAIVLQNLSVLTRGSTLRKKVLLLGGPNTYLPFLQDCWRLRIPQTWDERGYDYPKDVPVEELRMVVSARDHEAHPFTRSAALRLGGSALTRECPAVAGPGGAQRLRAALEADDRSGLRAAASPTPWRVRGSSLRPRSSGHAGAD